MEEHNRSITLKIAFYQHQTQHGTLATKRGKHNANTCEEELNEKSAKAVSACVVAEPVGLITGD